MSKMSATGGMLCVGGKRANAQISKFERRLHPEEEAKSLRKIRRSAKTMEDKQSGEME